MFSAVKTSGSYNVGSYLTSYQKFLTNHGNSFDLSSGIFIAPRNWVFEFSATTFYNADLGPVELAWFHLSVEKNGIGELSFGANNYFNSNDDILTFDWIMELQKGDTMQLKVIDGQFQCGIDTRRTNCLFSGKFIRDIGLE